MGPKDGDKEERRGAALTVECLSRCNDISTALPACVVAEEDISEKTIKEECRGIHRPFRCSRHRSEETMQKVFATVPGNKKII